MKRQKKEIVFRKSQSITAMTTPPSAGSQGQHLNSATIAAPVATPMLPPMGYAAPPPPPSPPSQRSRGSRYNSQQSHQRNQHATIPNRSGMGGGPDGVPVMKFSLDTPEDIEAWIAERKKKWPTDSNIGKKQQELNERIARGEMVPIERKRKVGPGGRGGAKRGRGTGQRGGSNNRMVHPNNQYTESNLSSTSPAGSNLFLTSTPPKPARPLKEQTVGVVAGYGSTSDEEEDDGPPEVVSYKQPSGTSHEKDEPMRNESRPACKYFARGKCGKGNKCRFTHDQSNKQITRSEATPRESEIFRRRPGLLRQLLAKEIRSETSTILQCLRFMVKNQFFDKGVQVWDVGIPDPSHILAQQELVDELSDESEGEGVDEL